MAALADRLGFEVLLTLAADKDSGFDRSRMARALLVAAGEPEDEFARPGMAAVDIAALRERGLAGRQPGPVPPERLLWPMRWFRSELSPAIAIGVGNAAYNPIPGRYT